MEKWIDFTSNSSLPNHVGVTEAMSNVVGHSEIENGAIFATFFEGEKGGLGSSCRKWDWQNHIGATGGNDGHAQNLHFYFFPL